MQLDNHSQILENLSNKSFTAREIEVAIRASLAVDDCVVINREIEKLKQELVAYIVPSGLFVPEQFLSHLKTILPSKLISTALVPVSTIPLTNTGQVDEAALASLEIIDSDLMDRIEEQLKSLSEIKRVAVVVEPFIRSIPSVHLQDLLGNTQVIASEDSQQKVQATILSQKIENKKLSSSKKLAISHGEPLQYSEDAPKTLKELLQRIAAQVISRLRENFSLDLSLQPLFKSSTIASLAHSLEGILGVTQVKSVHIEAVAQEYEEVRI